MPVGFDKNVLRKRITEARENHGLSQVELAQEAGVTPAAISQIEKGSRVPTIPVLHRIANVLKVSLDFLIGKTNKSEIEDMLQHDDFKTFFRGFESLNETDKEFIKKNIEFLRTKAKGR